MNATCAIESKLNKTFMLQLKTLEQKPNLPSFLIFISITWFFCHWISTCANFQLQRLSRHSRTRVDFLNLLRAFINNVSSLDSIFECDNHKFWTQSKTQIWFVRVERLICAFSLQAKRPWPAISFSISITSFSNSNPIFECLSHFHLPINTSSADDYM